MRKLRAIDNTSGHTLLARHSSNHRNFCSNAASESRVSFALLCDILFPNEVQSCPHTIEVHRNGLRQDLLQIIRTKIKTIFKFTHEVPECAFV